MTANHGVVKKLKIISPLGVNRENIMLPNFIIGGASRCGTTTLYHMLSQHPSIFMPAQKELLFFYKDDNYNQGQKFYEKNFSLAKAGQIIGEASPPYFHHGITVNNEGDHQWSEDDDSVTRMAGMVPNAKIILSLRNPIARVQSQIWKNIWQGNEKSTSFTESIMEEVDGQRNPSDSKLCWMYKNRYSTHIQHWLDHFPRENILFLVFEEWTCNPELALRKIESFLGIDPMPFKQEDAAVRNEGRSTRSSITKVIMPIARKLPVLRGLYKRVATKRGYPEPDEKIKLLLTEYFDEDIKALEALIGEDLSAWRAT